MCALHCRLRSRRSTLRPVNQIQIDVVCAKPLQAALELGGRIRARGIELGGDEHLVTPNPTLARRPPDTFLVAIDLGGVNVPVAELQRPAYGVDGRGPIGDLPHAEAEQRNLLAVCERARARISCFESRCHWTHLSFITAPRTHPASFLKPT